MINEVAVIGAGTMGHGIAQICAQAGIKVMLFDQNRRICPVRPEQN